MTARRYALAVICCVVCGVGSSWAGAGTTKRHQHGAHIHGTAAVNIAIDDRTAIIELTAPADSVVGFEHQAKSAVDQTRQAKALERLRNNMDSMVVFNPTLGCRFAPTKIDVVRQDAKSMPRSTALSRSAVRHHWRGVRCASASPEPSQEFRR